jgi:hypothetical protein
MKICAKKAPVIIHQQIKLPTIQVPFFIPGKSGGAIVPPPAAPIP